MVEIGDQTLLNHHSHAMLSTMKTKQKKNSKLPSIFPSRKLPLRQTPATEAEGYFEVYCGEIIC